MMNNILNCNKCKVFERKDPKPPLCNIMASEPMDFVHINLLGLETTMNTIMKPDTKVLSCPISMKRMPID